MNRVHTQDTTIWVFILETRRHTTTHTQIIVYHFINTITIPFLRRLTRYVNNLWCLRHIITHSHFVCLNLGYPSPHDWSASCTTGDTRQMALDRESTGTAHSHMAFGTMGGPLKVGVLTRTRTMPVVDWEMPRYAR